MPGPATLLVVEDEPLTAEMLQTYFERLSFVVLVAHSADDALRLTATREPDALITDLLLRGSESGLSLARRLRERFPELPIILTSGLPETEVNAAATDLPDVIVAPKPVRLARLRELVESCLKHG